MVIFQRLSRTPMTGSELAQGLPISRTAVVQHLKLLDAARLVDASPRGRKRVYRIRPKGLVPLDQWVRQHLDEAVPADHRTPAIGSDVHSVGRFANEVDDGLVGP
jgi:DNA-binding transcriptional ArsR family regulator